jgi:hypothetical protein
MCQAICRIDGTAAGIFVGRYPKGLIGWQRWRCHIFFTIPHGMACAQAYATAQSVCHLPIERLMKKIRSGEAEMSDLVFSGTVLSKNKTFTKLSPNSDFRGP